MINNAPLLIYIEEGSNLLLCFKKSWKENWIISPIKFLWFFGGALPFHISNINNAQNTLQPWFHDTA